jgi:hypothetical protein
MFLLREKRRERSAEESIWVQRGGKKKLYDEKLHSLYCSTNTIKVRWVVHAARLEVVRNAFEIFLGYSEEKRLLHGAGMFAYKGNTPC